ncbi:MAG: ACP S-malonyltransferase [Lacipirellulaceae bacterium]
MATPVGFLFPGQGAQHVGMGAEVAAEVPAAGELYARAEDVLGYNLLALSTSGPSEQLDATVYSQPALYVASLAALERLRRDDPAVVEACVAAAGLSLGEYTALAFAGVFSFEDGLRVVAERGAAMQDAAEATPSGMVSVLGLDVPKIEALCAAVLAEPPFAGQTLRVANLLCPGNTVCSGSNAACERLAETAEAAGAIKVVPLAVAGAFHTPLMKPAVERLAAVLADVPMHAPRLPVVSNVDATAHDDPAEIRGLLVRQVESPVMWEASVRELLAGHGVMGFYEIGPGRVLRGLLKRIDRGAACESVA